MVGWEARRWRRNWRFTEGTRCGRAPGRTGPSSAKRSERRSRRVLESHNWGGHPSPNRRGEGALAGVRRLRGIELRGADAERHDLPHPGAPGGPPLARRRGHHHRLHLRRDRQRHRGSGLRTGLRRRAPGHLLPRSGSRSPRRSAPRTEAIMPVHLACSMADMDRLRRAGAASRASRRRGLRSRPRRPLERSGRRLDRRFRLVLDAEHQADDGGRGRDRHHERRHLRAAPPVPGELRPQGGRLRRVPGADVGE